MLGYLKSPDFSPWFLEMTQTHRFARTDPIHNPVGDPRIPSLVLNARQTLSLEPTDGGKFLGESDHGFEPTERKLKPINRTLPAFKPPFGRFVLRRLSPPHRLFLPPRDSCFQWPPS